MYRIDGMDFKDLRLFGVRPDGSLQVLASYTSGQIAAMITGRKMDEQFGSQKEPAAHQDNKLGVKGVSRHGSGYRASVTLNGKQKHLGTYKTIEEAVQAREETLRSSSSPTPESKPVIHSVSESIDPPAKFSPLEEMLRKLDLAEQEEG